MQHLDGLKELQETVEAPQVQYTGIFATSTSHRCLNFKGIEILRNRQVRFGDRTVGVRLCCPSAMCKKGGSFHVHPFRRMVGVPAVSQRLVPTVSKVLKTVEQRWTLVFLSTCLARALVAFGRQVAWRPGAVWRLFPLLRSDDVHLLFGKGQHRKRTVWFSTGVPHQGGGTGWLSLTTTTRIMQKTTSFRTWITWFQRKPGL